MSSLIQELVAENQLLRVQLDALAAQQPAPKATAPLDAFDLDTIELLKAEVERLQIELAGRDLIQNANALANERHSSLDATCDTEDSRLLARLDELLSELDQSDQRIAVLEELLRASEEATAAEREERSQLESWVTDIERRIGDREADWKAEIELLRTRLSQADQQRTRLDQSLGAVQNTNDLHSRAEIESQSWQVRAAELQQQLADADRERLSLAQKVRELEQQTSGFKQSAELENELREERVKIAQERAEIARERADLVTLRAQLNHSASTDSPSLEVENRMRAFRQHLREIHDQEVSAPQQQKGLSARLAQLWKRLDDRI